MQIKADIRYALRQFAKAPGFTITAILTLALGIGATTAIFTLVYAVLLKSLPVVDPEDLFRVGNEENCCVTGGMQDNWTLFSYEQYKQFSQQASGFAELSAFQAGQTMVGVRRNGSAKAAEPYKSEFVSGNYFSTFGILPYLGRTITPNDDTKGAPAVAVMSFRTWQEKFGKDNSVVGAGFVINGEPFTVVGITPPAFFGDRVQSVPPNFFIPLNKQPLISPTRAILEDASLDWLDLIGRIHPGVNAQALEARFQAELRQFLLSPLSKVEGPDKPLVAKQTLHFSQAGSGVQMMRSEYKEGLHLLMWVSGFVLLIACANLANLMLVRAAHRQQQTSVRSALGASRMTLVRQTLTESILLAVLGGSAGVALAFVGTRVILFLAFRNDPVPIPASPSLPVLGFALVVSMLTGVLFGVWPAWLTSKTHPIDALRGANRSTVNHGSWGQKSLVVIQAALSLVLLFAAGLLARSFSNMQHQDFGFVTTRRYILHIDPQMAGYRPNQLQPLYRQLNVNLVEIPGVRQVSFSMYSPMEGDNWGESVFIEGEPPPQPGNSDPGASWVRVSPHYFETTGTKIVEGRSMNQQDTPTTRNVAVVNGFFEKKYFRDGHAIGKHFGDDVKHPGWFEIVGVTEDTHYWGPSEKMRPMYFLAQGQSVHSEDPQYQQFEDRSQYLKAIEIETDGNVPEFETQVRHAVAQVNPDLAVINFQSFAEQVTSNFTQQAMIAKLTSFFGVLALVLASIGLFGVTAYSVERLTSEIGIHMALGADRRSVLFMILRGAFMQVGTGLAIGIPVAILGGRAMASQLFGVKPYDPLILSIALLVLCGAAFLAALLPARMAANLEPMRALRTE